jgi:hypothetical protein
MTGGGPADLAPFPVTVLFLAIVAGMWALVVAGVARAARFPRPDGTMRPAIVTGVVLAGWLALTLALAAAGFFADFRALPPRFLVVLAPALAALVWLGRARSVGRLLATVPPAWLVWPQTFRILVEIVLWRLIVAGAAPEIMTFTGRNFDVLVGLTAPVVAYGCFVARWWGPRVAIWWNVAGLLILVNTVVHAQLAAPTRFQVYVTEPPNTFLASVPYIWLAAFLVPLAWGLHVLSIRRLVGASPGVPTRGTGRGAAR